MKQLKFKVDDYVQFLQSCSEHKKGDIEKLVVAELDRGYSKYLTKEMLIKYPKKEGWIPEESMELINININLKEINSLFDDVII